MKTGLLIAALAAATVVWLVPQAQAETALKPGGFACRVSPDGKTVTAVIVNPYKSETSCQVDCQVSTTRAGTTLNVSCGKPAAPGVEAVLCTQSYDKGKLVKMTDGKGSCIDPTPKPDEAEKDEEDAQKLMEKMRRNMPPPAANKQSDEDMQKLMDDPAKMQDFIRKQMGKP